MERALPKFVAGPCTIGIGTPHFLCRFGLTGAIGEWRALSPYDF
jgi:hypothetical protein